MLKTYQLLRIGEHHINHCEDYTIIENLGPHKLLCAVMDGCTMGTDSYFASTIVGKLLRKIAIEKSYQSFFDKNHRTTVQAESKEIIRELMAELKRLKSQLLLKEDELLTTLMLAVLDTQRNVGQVIVIGDGLISINGQLIEYEQDNKPDYLGYYLSEDFETWYASQKQIVYIDHMDDISISTDGIFTFSKYDKQLYTYEKDPIDYLLINREDEELESMLTKKFLYLANQCGMKPTDDLGIIRIINKNKILL